MRYTILGGLEKEHSFFLALTLPFLSVSFLATAVALRMDVTYLRFFLSESSERINSFLYDEAVLDRNSISLNNESLSELQVSRSHSTAFRRLWLRHAHADELCTLAFTDTSHHSNDVGL